MCKLELTKHYGCTDNYSSSFRSKEQYRQVKEDKISTHNKIGLSLKCTYTSVSTGDKILDQLVITEKISHFVTF